jgi:hypothetical protein
MTGITPSPEQIEAGAREAFWWDDQNGHIRGGGRLTFDTLPEVGRQNYRDLARAVLTVAFDLVPGGPR